jgi:hypothetical protein
MEDAPESLGDDGNEVKAKPRKKVCVDEYQYNIRFILLDIL